MLISFVRKLKIEETWLRSQFRAEYEAYQNRVKGACTLLLAWAKQIGTGQMPHVRTLSTNHERRGINPPLYEANSLDVWLAPSRAGVYAGASAIVYMLGQSRGATAIAKIAGGLVLLRM
jgi:hypothetical protein